MATGHGPERATWISDGRDRVEAVAINDEDAEAGRELPHLIRRISVCRGMNPEGQQAIDGTICEIPHVREGPGPLRDLNPNLHFLGAKMEQTGRGQGIVQVSLFIGRDAAIIAF